MHQCPSKYAWHIWYGLGRVTTHTCPELLLCLVFGILVTSSCKQIDIYIYIYIRLPNIRCCHMHFCWTHSSQPEKHAERKPRIIDNDNSFRSGKSEVRYGELWYLSPRSMVTWVSTYGPKIDQILRVYAWEMPCLKAHIWGISSAE